MISVVVPAFNTERYVGATLASVLSQEVGELIAVDDGSTDGTHAVLLEWARRDQRVSVLRSDRNEGIAAALRKGVAAARGEYVVCHDSDDLSMPGRFALQRAALETDRDAVMVAGWADLIDAHGRAMGETRRSSSAEAVTFLLHFNNVIGGLGRVMMRRDALLAAGIGERQLAVDYEVWSRVVRQGKLLVLPSVVVQYRVHEGGVSARRKEQQLRDAQAVSRSMIGELLGRPLSDEEHAAVAGMWTGGNDPRNTPAAFRVLREAEGRFACSAEARRLIRREIARRWTRAARGLVKRARLLEALRCLWYAARTAAAL